MSEWSSRVGDGVDRDGVFSLWITPEPGQVLDRVRVTGYSAAGREIRELDSVDRENLSGETRIDLVVAGWWPDKVVVEELDSDDNLVRTDEMLIERPE